MLLVAGLVCLLVGVWVLTAGLRADLAVRRWERTTGRIRAARFSHLTEDGRQLWDVEVVWRDHAGQDHVKWFRQVGVDVDRRTGEQVSVWFDPHHPDRADMRLAGNAAGGGWPYYLVGALFLLGGTLATALALT